MEVRYEIKLGRWDDFFARRVLSKGPNELQCICNGEHRLFNLVLKYKWRQDPLVKCARKLSNLVSMSEKIDKDSAAVFKQKALAEMKEVFRLTPYVYTEFLLLFEDSSMEIRFDKVVNDLFSQNDKINEAALKVIDRTAVLEMHDLDYNIDYWRVYNKKLEEFGLKVATAAAFCWHDFEFVLWYIKAFFQLCNDGARLDFANVLFRNRPELLELYQNNVAYREYVLGESKKAVEESYDYALEVYRKVLQFNNAKHKDYERYKQLIATKQLEKFRKK
ncbi:MAG: hypothetical protein IKZ34_02540 [Alphaproteobacteria bacterium]|nr:hypothetical protein [Alphaproteobacteria bacterium]